MITNKNMMVAGELYSLEYDNIYFMYNVLLYEVNTNRVIVPFNTMKKKIVVVYLREVEEYYKNYLVLYKSKTYYCPNHSYCVFKKI